MRLLRLAIVLLLPALAALGSSGGALAAGGNYVFAGGTAYEQQQVRQALAISAFDWSVVPAQITIHIAENVDSEATPGQIWLDSALLDSGEFSWGVVQHEYAHQVEFELFDDATRARLDTLLGGVVWYPTIAGLKHEQYGCERFASTLAWAYWPSTQNSMKPTSSPTDESAAMPPAQFRALMASLLGVADPPVATANAAQRGYAPPRATQRRSIRAHG